MEVDTILQLQTIAEKVAVEAGGYITAAPKPNNVGHKINGSSLASQVVTKVDVEVQELILKKLQPSVERLDLGIMAEESEVQTGCFKKAFYWCIDPIDGTLNFINQRPGFAVSIALVDQNGAPVVGVVYDPVRSMLYSASIGNGAKINGRPWRLVSKKSNSLFCDHSFYTHNKRVLWEQYLNGLLLSTNERFEIQPYQGAVLNAIGALRHQNGLYLKFPKNKKGGGCYWDFAATTCMANEMDAQAINFDSRRLAFYERKDVFMNEKGVLFANNKQWANRLIQDKANSPTF